MDKELIEKLAELEHDQWSHWEKYRETAEHKLNKDGVPNLDNWRRQRATLYKDLTKKEKDSDRKWAYKVIKIITEHNYKKAFGSSMSSSTAKEEKDE